MNAERTQSWDFKTTNDALSDIKQHL